MTPRRATGRAASTPKYATHKLFFKGCAYRTIALSPVGGEHASQMHRISVEELYQHFINRLQDELAESSDDHTKEALYS